MTGTTEFIRMILAQRIYELYIYNNFYYVFIYMGSPVNCEKDLSYHFTWVDHSSYKVNNCLLSIFYMLIFFFF